MAEVCPISVYKYHPDFDARLPEVWTLVSVFRSVMHSQGAGYRYEKAVLE